MSIKAIYFDFGGVIVRTDEKASRSALAAEFGMTYEEMDRFVFESQTAKLSSIGKMSEEEHWLDVTRRLGRPAAEMPRIRDAFFGGDMVDQELVGLLRSLKGTCQRGLISNAWDGLREWIKDIKIEDAFDHLTISAEVGFAKPDPRIYQFALNKLGVSAGEAIFVDDVAVNIRACEELGMHGVLFRDTAQALGEIRELMSAAE